MTRAAAPPAENTAGGIRATARAASVAALFAAALLAGGALLAASPARGLRAAGLHAARAAARGGGCCDWPEFGYDPARSDVGPAQTGITAANVGGLRRQQVALDGTVDSSPIYLHGVTIGGRPRDAIFLTTTYGRTEAVDAASGRVLWRFTPPDYASYAGTAQITTASPVADPDREAIYAAAPDGVIRKLSVATGAVEWASSITRNPAHERLAAALNYSRGHVIETTGGYYGDIPPYQGEVVTLDPASGAIVGVWNALCSGRHGRIDPATCPQSDAGIWGRSGAVVVPGSGDLLVATGNGPFDGSTAWGDSVLLLSPDASRLLAHWTPVNQAQLDSGDVDLGSTAPALLSGGLFVQGGKDGILRLVALDRMAGVSAATGGELQDVSAPGGAGVFAAPAVWNGTWVFVANGGGTAAWRLGGGRLHAVWANNTAGTSPVLAGGLLYVEGSGGIVVYAPASGRRLATLTLGEAHMQSPIVVAGMVVAGEGNYMAHATSGVLDIYRLPGS